MTNSFIFRILTWIILLIIMIALSLSPHPVTIIILIIIYNILICLNISFWKQTYIYSLLYFLIIITGLLIIFLYFSSLISNEKYKAHYKPTIWIRITFFLFLIFNYSYSPDLTSTSHLSWNSFLTLSIKYPWTPYTETISFIYSHPLINFTLLRIIFLLVTLLSIIKISTPKIKSLRKITI